VSEIDLALFHRLEGPRRVDHTEVYAGRVALDQR
jgi:hypothetical protein